MFLVAGGLAFRGQIHYLCKCTCQRAVFFPPSQWRCAGFFLLLRCYPRFWSTKIKKVEILLGCSYCVRNSKGKDNNTFGYYFRLGIKEVLESQSFPKSPAEGAKHLQEMCPTHPLLLQSLENRETLLGTSWPWNSTGSIKDASAFVWWPPDFLFLSPGTQNRTFISGELISDSGLVSIWSRNPLWRSNWLLCKGFRSYMLRIMTLFGVKKQCQENS